MTKLTAKKLTTVALEEVGYLEKKSNANLTSKTANSGSNNYTKYGKWIGANGDYWCASFVSWCFAKAFGESEGRTLLGCYSASCEVIRNKFKASGRYDNTPKVGSVIFFSGSRHSGANHIGIVYKVDNNYIYTVEGNTSGGSAVIDNGGGVAKKTYKRGYSRILGYGQPKYDTDSTEGLKNMKTIKNGSTGHSVNILQAILKDVYGKTLSVDGDFGNNTENQLKNVQTKLGLTSDGICGDKTWAAMTKE